MGIEPAPLDLYRCGQRFPERVTKKGFGMPLVKVAKKIVWSGMDEKEERTLEKCLVALINEIEYSTNVGFFPLSFSWRKVNYFDADNDEVEYIAKSLIATTKLYETQLSVLNTRGIVA